MSFNYQIKSTSTLSVGVHTSSPLPAFTHPQYPSALKQADISKKKGVITAYLTVYNNDDGTPFVDPYNDIVAKGSFTKTIAVLDAARKQTNNPWLCPDLWQHDRNEIIGGIKALTEDSRGVIYEAHLATGVRRAQEALELAEMKAIGSSYGYDPIRFDILPGNVRKLNEMALREVTQCSFPANHLADIISVKGNRFISYPTYPKPQVSIDTLCEQLVRVVRDEKREGETLDREWLRARAKAYAENPTAFKDNSRFNSWGK
jgi:HK97 family phage prohead protease